MTPNDFKTALLVLPAEEIAGAHLERIQRALRYRFPVLEQVDICAPDSCLAAVRQTLATMEIRGYNGTRFWEYPIAVLVLDGDGRNEAIDRIDFNRCRVYEVGQGGMLRYCRRELDEIEYPHVKTHVFNRLAAQLGNERLCYFPYGFNSQYVGLGPIDAFGHRISERIEDFVGRGPGHLLIAVFGGSGAWSIHNLYDEMFTTLLKESLNDHCQKKGIPLKVSVLNLAQPSGVILNDIVRYILFCFEARPDLVISHSGLNDLAFGQTSDRYLVAEHKIVYQFELERWAEILQNETTDHSSIQDWESIPIQTYPRMIIKALITRLRQFQELVTRSGGYFIAGMQPMIFSKSGLSSSEAEWMSKYENIYYGPVLKNLPYLLSELLSRYPTLGCDRFVNLHEVFGQYGSERTLFGDAVHTVREGEVLIAQAYSEYIIENLMDLFLQRSSDEN